MRRDEAISVAKRALSTFAVCLSVATLVAAVATVPADARKRRGAEKAEEAIPDPADGQPMTLIVSLGQQNVSVYRGTTLITTSRVSTGKRGYSTKAGVFTILQKKRHHYSNLYAGAPMPWMQRVTWSGTALHAGVVPGYPASHGCIRLPYSFAPRLFKITTVGEHVVVARDKVEPELIQHPALFQPLPPPEPPTLVKQQMQEPPKERQSSNEIAPVPGPHLPVILAKAEFDDVVTDAPAIEIPASAPDAHGLAPIGNGNSGHAAMTPGQGETDGHAPLEDTAPISVPEAVGEDTHVHAINPAAGTSDQGGAHAIASPSSASEDDTSLHASASLTKDQGRLGGEDTPAPNAELPASGESEAAKVEPSPVLPVSATVDTQAEALVPVSTASEDEAHPPVPPTKPSVIAAKLVAGAAAAGKEAAEPPSTAPLRILVTRRTQRDRMRDVQYVLSSMGYLEAQNFDGTFGRLTANAIKAFQKANELPETGAFTDDVVKKIYEVAGKDEPPVGHLFVRQEFASVFDTAVNFRDPDEPLGTHVFTVLKFEPGDTEAQWMAISLQGDADSVLDRLEIPDDVRQKISERLTPGSSLIIGDTAINSATLPKGADFLVWDTGKPGKVQRASVGSEVAQPRKKKKKRVRRSRRRNNYSFSPPPVRRGFPAWPF